MSCNCVGYKDLLHEYEECVEQILEQQKFGEPMMWIGIYVAAASLLCSLAAIVDTLRCIQQRKIWFPCKYFTLNATSLTVLAVVTKITLDINNPMPSEPDQLVKLSSTVFLCTVMGNTMPSLGTMEENEIIVNLIALGILVITIVVNVCIQLDTGLIYNYLKIENILVSILTFVLYVILSFSALAVPITKQDLEWKYGEIHRLSSSEEEAEETSRKITIEKLAGYVKRYWIMAETGNPQFVMARFATCSSVGAICFLAGLILIEAELQMAFRVGSWFSSQGKSDYKSTTLVILLIHTIGVVIGTIAPTFRWFIAVSLKWSVDGGKNCENFFTVEQYWIQRLVELKENPIALRIRGRKRRRLVQGTKDLTLNLCIRVQIVIVVFSKMVRLISILCASPVLSCCYYYHRSKRKQVSEPENETENEPSGDSNNEPEPGTTVDLSRYVLRLEGEKKLPKRILKNISAAVDRMIRWAKRQQPNNLMNLISKSTGFRGVVDFDSDQVDGLHSEGPPNCWSLAVVTLTSIAVALPNSTYESIEQLICCVKEGLNYVRRIEKGLDTKRKLVHVRKTADFVWLGVELYWWWLDKDLRKLNLTGETKTSKKTLEILTDISKTTILEFKRNTNGGLEDDPVNWPSQVLASNSMYRISQTILMDYMAVNDETSERLFEQLSVTIADILGACLTNLPRVIIMHCYCSTIEKREENVNLAARLLGETEEILKILHQHETPDLNHDQVVYIDEWRALLKQQGISTVNSMVTCLDSNNDSYSPDNSDEVCIGIE
ncbi:hypothetical protein LguiA_015486 [Lonicera macranthoides]